MQTPINRLPEPPPPKEGCCCPHHHHYPGYCKPCQPLDCPGGDLCFKTLARVKGRKRTWAIRELIKRGVCVCDARWLLPSKTKYRGVCGVISLPKQRRETTPRCACGMYFSNHEVRGLGLFSKSEWRSQGYRPKDNETPVASVWRTVFWAGCTGGRIQKVGLYSKEQVKVIRGRVPECTG